MFKVKKWYKPWKKNKKLISYRFRNLWGKTPLLRFGFWAKKIQRFYRLYWFLCFKMEFALDMSRFYRGMLGRRRFKFILLMKRIFNAKILQFAFRVYAARKKRKFRIKREHMAAFKMQRFVMRNLNAKSRLRINAAVKAKEKKENLALKKSLQYKKRKRIQEKIYLWNYERHVVRVQKRWRSYILEKKKRKAAEKNRKKLMQEAENEIMDIKRAKKSFLSVLLNPLKSVKKGTKALLHLLDPPSDIISKEDAPRIRNSVLKFNSRSIKQEGIVEIKLTVGEAELKKEQKLQDYNERGNMEYFKMVKDDLSGILGLKIFIWFLEGSGSEVICEISIEKKPVGKSTVALKTRASKIYIDNIRVVWNEESPIEIHAHKSIKQGKAKFALTDIAVANSTEEEDAYSNKGYKHVASLKPFGFETSVFVLAKEPVDDDELFDFGTLSGNEWFDKRLIKCVKTFNLTEDDVMKLRWRFEKIQGNSAGMVNYIRVNDIFRTLGISI